MLSEALDRRLDRLRSAGMLGLGLLLAFAFGLAVAEAQHRAILPVVGSFLVLIVMRWPFVGFLGVIASLPLDVSGTFGETALTKLSITKSLAALTLVAAGLELLLHHRRVRVCRFVTPEVGLTALLLLIVVASAAVHPSEEAAASAVRQMVIVLFVLVTVYFVDTPDRLRRTLLLLVTVGSAIALYSIGQRILRPVGTSEEWAAQAGAVVDVGEENLGEMLRTTGTFSHPAWLGLFLTLCIPFTLGLCWRSPYLRWRAAGLAAVVVQVLGVLSTYSRMSYIAAGLGLAMFLARRRLGIAVLTLAVIGSVVMFPALPEDFQSRVYSIVEYRESSSSLSRIGQQIAAFYMFLDHPVLGAGPGNFEQDVLGYRSRVPVALEVQAIGTHNMYLQAAAELGFAGLITLICLLLVTWHRLRRFRIDAARRGDEDMALHWEAAGIAFWAFLVSAFFVHAQYRKEWWLLVGLAAAGRQFGGSRKCSSGVGVA